MKTFFLAIVAATFLFATAYACPPGKTRKVTWVKTCRMVRGPRYVVKRVCTRRPRYTRICRTVWGRGIRVRRRRCNWLGICRRVWVHRRRPVRVCRRVLVRNRICRKVRVRVRGPRRRVCTRTKVVTCV